MDADDGLMLNFAPATPGPSKVKPKANANGRNNRPPSNGSANPRRQPPPPPASSSPPITSTPAKRPRPSQSVTDDISEPQNKRPARPPPSKSALSSRPPKQQPTTFISSLFSGPPDINAASANDEEEKADAQRRLQTHKPTNAPTDTSTFQGLGLDPLLVAHLSGPRMDIGNRPTGIQRTGLPALLSGDESRDILIHSQTGSGKTLTYLLPILQSLLPLCEETWIDRSVGTLAIILAPTRELARQIYEVTEKLCQLHLSLRSSDDSDQEQTTRRTRWLVPGLLSGGSTKNHEKSRLRKGIPILIATPGRLLDHLQNTSSFDVGKCRWLVLDEADRLFELGFKDTLEAIIKAMDGRRRLAFNTAKEALQEQRDDQRDIPIQDVTDGTGVPWWEKPRKVVLCSATLDENVQMLAGTHLRKPLVVRGGAELAPVNGTAAAASSHSDQSDQQQPSSDNTALYPRIAAPAQLRQHAVVVPPKLRLVSLIALLRSALSRQDATTAETRRVIVFISSTDSVEFHWNALGGLRMGPDDNEEEPSSTSMSKTCELFPQTPIYRLHGSLSQADRIASLKGFSSSKSSSPSASGAVLLCTSVAARGLDLPSVGCVIQLDPPTEGGVDEYLHRVGRTARVGRAGESYLCLLPHEQDARGRLESAMSSSSNDASHTSHPSIASLSSPHILKRGFGGKGTEYESRATDVQLAFERLVLSNERMASLARRAFLSFIRAYATHPASEKDLFHVRFLHLGHLAKSFALRETPDDIKAKVKVEQRKSASGAHKHPNAARMLKKEQAQAAAAEARRSNRKQEANDEDGGVDSDSDDDDAIPRITSSTAPAAPKHLLDSISSSRKTNDAEARMYAKVREMGRQIKSGGRLAAYGADEFQLG